MKRRDTTKRGMLIIFIVCLAAASFVGLVMLTGIDGVLARWLVLYRYTPPITTAILALGAGVSIFRNRQDQARLILVWVCLFCSLVYVWAAVAPPWWIIYGESLKLSGINILFASMILLSIYRRGSRI